MLAYAAHRRRVAAQRSAPHAMLGIMVAHIAVIAIVMSAKMDLPRRIFDAPITVENIPVSDPPPEQPKPQPQTRDSETVIEQPAPFVPLPQPTDTYDLKPNPIPLPPDLGAGPRFDPLPKPTPLPVKVGPRFLTPAGLVRPPYPLDKLKAEEEASLRLRLSIDERGRVVSVDPVGRADRAFLLAARRHILAQWHYQPATVDGRPMVSSTVVTLRFQLNS